MSGTSGPGLKPETSRDLLIEPRKAEFARRLIAAMESRGLGAAELTRRVRQHLPSDSPFQSANLAQYCAGAAIPKRTYREALCKALDIKEEELVPPDEGHAARRRRVPLWMIEKGIRDLNVTDGRKEDLPAFLVQDKGGGTALVQMNQELPWSKALEIAELLGRKASIEAPAAEKPTPKPGLSSEE